jgi:hypothetical protein
METENRFDLNGAITHWNAELAAQESIGSAEMRELELHLREDLAKWIEKGLSEREAFQIGEVG